MTEAIPNIQMQTDHDTKSAPHGHGLHMLMLGTALAAGAVILSPYLLPAIGVGGTEWAAEALSILHGVGKGSGLVGIINGVLGAIPIIGPTLAEGGLASAGIAAATGLGGALLGRFIEEKQNGKPGINWGKVIKYAAVTTSIFISMPAVLTGISVGLVYLGAAFGGSDLAGAMVPILKGTLGSMGAMKEMTFGLAGAMLALPHLLTCGAGLLPAMFSFKLASDEKIPLHTPAVKSESFTARLGAERDASAQVQPAMSM
jgi:hypothetical protein